MVRYAELQACTNFSFLRGASHPLELVDAAADLGLAGLGVAIYEIAGPLFFGAAKSAMEALHSVGDKDHTYILDMHLVPTMDATGLVALESVLDRLRRSKIKVIFAGLTPEVSDMFSRAGIKRELGKIAYAPDLETAVCMAIVHAARVGKTTMSSPSIKIPKPDDGHSQSA